MAARGVAYVVFLRQLPEGGDAVAEGSDGAGGLGHVGSGSGGGEGCAHLGVVDDVFTAGRAVVGGAVWPRSKFCQIYFKISPDS